MYAEQLSFLYSLSLAGERSVCPQALAGANERLHGGGDPGPLCFVWPKDRLSLLHGGFKCLAQHSHGVVEAPVKQGPPGPGEGNSCRLKSY